MDERQTTAPTLGRSRDLLLRVGPQLLLILILAVGAYLRFSGLDWDEGTHLHPDERFLTLVETSIAPVSNLGEYFDTERSTLNPNNVGHTFFVYGTFPIFIVRYLGQWIGQTGYGEIHLVGRAASATFDLITILLAYLIGTRLFRRRVGLLAAAFSAVTVLLIQHSHFFVVDPFLTTFMVAGFYFSLRIQDEGDLASYLLFGLFLGMSAASKVSSAPLAGVAVAAASLRVLRAEDDRGGEIRDGIVGLLAAAGVSIVMFRLLQPYAFRGPGFFGLLPNPKWLETMGEIRLQTSGAVDFPPALQWADRPPVWFSLKNMVLWGMGVPLGLAAWLGWGWASYRLIKQRAWQRYLLIVAWPFGYFIWQSSGFVQAMRYQLPIYPLMAVLAAWGLWQLHDRMAEVPSAWRRLLRPATLGLSAIVLISTASYAFSFLRVYTNESTRVAASRWIYSHVPAGINVVIDSDEGELLEPLAVPTDFILRQGKVERVQFRTQHEGHASGVLIPFARRIGQGDQPIAINARLMEVTGEERTLASAQFQGDLPVDAEDQLVVEFLQSAAVVANGTYALELSYAGSPALQLEAEPALVLETTEGEQLEGIPLQRENTLLNAGEPHTISWEARQEGVARAIRMGPTLPLGQLPLLISGRLVEPGSGETLSTGALEVTDSSQFDAPTTLKFEEPATLEAGMTYQLVLEVSQGEGLVVRGSILVHETSWDDPLPQRVDGYDIGGRYTGRNLELYWADDDDSDQDGQLEKTERIVDSLSEGDYLFITSNRQYGSIARVPVRYPLSTAFYRELFNCPVPQAVWRCADHAQIGEINNGLGYELIQVFEANPAYLGIEVSDQGAEESFTVYDHPQVLIFAKTEEFDPTRLRSSLEAVSVARVQNAIPRDLQAGYVQALDLQLPAVRWQGVRTSGTWSRLFPPDNPLNRSQPLAILVWWITLGFLGVLAWPMVRRAFPGLTLGGYGISRVVGLLLLAWGTWVIGSVGFDLGRLGVWATLLGLLAIAGSLAWRDRYKMLADLRSRRREILAIELLALGFFLLDLAIRMGNPDLWHPSKGGEKPMDLSYLNAVLKSPTFPPFDPWFAGGYINYYYFGFLLVGMPMKLLGIETGIGYNLAIPTLMALLALAAYTAASHLVLRPGARNPDHRSRWAGVAAALSLVLLGNLGTVRMLWEALQQVGGGTANNPLHLAIVDAFQGVIGILFEGRPLPIALDAWYWAPSRAIPPGPGEPGPITEFPFFTFLYADLHAHLISLPLTVTALTWAISKLRAAAEGLRLTRPSIVGSLVIGGLIVGALRPTNTWDFPVYMILVSLAVLATPLVGRERLNLKSMAAAVGSTVLLIGLAFVLFQPYSRWYGQGYNAASLWQGAKTPLDAYFTVYGLFLFVLGSWLIWETWHWMATTPLVALARVRRWLPLIAGALVSLALGILIALLLGYSVTLVVVPAILWAGLLLLRRDQAVGKRITLFLLGTGLALTLVVEVVVLQGDIGRMNTVFKFYLQVWTLFSVAAGAAFAWLLSEQREWSLTVRGLWQLGLAVLVFGAALYPLTATPAKIRDRMSIAAPRGLDGMAFMKSAVRSELGKSFELDEDYEAIQWMQENVIGSPVIVEANIPEYRWGSRYTIYTGLPGVLGWNWHQRQQRVAANSEQVTERARQISEFYTTQSLPQATAFLEEHDVEFVVLGELERIYYGTLEPCLPSGDGGGTVTCDLSTRPMGTVQPTLTAADCESIDPENPESPLRCPTGGLQKFERLEEQGALELAFETGSTRIYRVIGP